MSDIDFLRQLGEDLKEAARNEASERRAARSGKSRRWSSRKLTAVFVVPALAAAAVLSWTLTQGGTQGRRPPSERPQVQSGGAGNPRLGQVITGANLWAIDASSPNNVWAVGGVATSQTRGRGLVLRWDGSTWKEIIGPETPLNDVAVVSPTDVWGIGGDIGQAKIFHWDGTHWSETAHRDPPGTSFAHIGALSKHDVWVVGTKFGAEYAPNTVGTDTLIEHWNGTRWSVVPSPNPTRRGNWLNGVVALSPTDVWAIGYSETTAPQGKTMTLHWNGRTWSIVPSANPGKSINFLGGTGRDGAGGIWAGGHSLADRDAPLEALYMRLDGKVWEVVPPPSGDDSHMSVDAFAGSSANDVWAVGSPLSNSFFIAHWDGSAWKAVKAELPPGSQDANLALHDVVALSPDDAWAVGGYQLTKRVGSLSQVQYLPVLEHWDGIQWRLVNLAPIASS